MHLEMFFNELSLVPAANISEGQRQVDQFVQTIRAATHNGIGLTLQIPENFFSSAIAPEYYWNNWLKDDRIDIEFRRFFRSIATKTPFLRDTPDMEADWRDIDCLWQNQFSLGFKAAYIADGLALSIPSRSEWDVPWIECTIHELVNEEVDIRLESIHHAVSPNHLDSHLGWIHGRIQNAVGTGCELWQQRNNFFPLLIFCNGVEQQMTGLPAAALPSIVRGLTQLNAFCISWKSGGFNPNNIKCSVSPESQTTLNLYRTERTFLCPDGWRQVFSWHAKLGSWRVYFDPAPGPSHLLIGYVGNHLRTVRFI